MSRRVAQPADGPLPEYEETTPVANKITLCPGTDHERTILLKVPEGKAGREKTVRLLPLMAHLQQFDGKEIDLALLSSVIGQLWSKDDFEDEILPFVLGMESANDRAYLDEHLGLIEAFDVFARAASYVMSGGMREEVQAALKK